MNAKTIAGRPYVMGSGVLDTTGRQRILVIDVADGKVVSKHQSAASATLEMIRYAKANQIKTKLAIASDFGDGRPLVITETY